ncbi:putative flap endonuclease [uncultured virus]|uniref:Putative flap endonuclease n=1 Tax=uncultured virus TaxID=340016 RepID=A0A218MKA5_9VIRU|nr:putative flap endonuclease [uncultured virus]
MTFMTKSWNDLEDLQTPDYSEYNNLLIIDGNNLSYRWLQRPNHGDFKHDFVRTIQSLAKSYEAGKTIVCFDFGKSYFRKELYDEYKQNRKKAEVSEEDKQRFEDFFNVLNDLPEYLDDTVLKFRGVEADDIITYLAIHESKNYNHTWIVSSDRDLYQLMSDNISIFNMFSRKEVTIETLLEDFKLSPELYLLSRIIEGDKGDNIYGVEGIGPKRAQALALEYKTLDTLLSAFPIPGKAKYIQNLNQSKDILLRNSDLIDLKKNYMIALEKGKEDDVVEKLLNKLT